MHRYAFALSFDVRSAALTVLFVALGFHFVPARVQAEESAGAPVDAATVWADAQAAYLRGEYEEAIEKANSAAESGANEEAAVVLVGRALKDTGRYAEALVELERLDGSAEAAALRAEILVILGKYDEATALCRGAIEEFPRDPSPRLVLGKTLELLGKRTEAIEVYRWFDTRIAGGGDLERDARWLVDCGQGFLRFSVLTQTNIRARTAHVLTQMLQVAYEIVDRSYLRGRVVAGDLLRDRYNNDDIDGSVSDYQAVLAINPRQPDALVGLGEVALSVWNFEGVEDNAGLALETNPNHPGALRLLAKKLIVERRYEQAGEQAAKALEINARDIEAISIQAAAAACRFDDDRVKDLEARVEKIAPRCAAFHRIVGDALGGIRQYAESEAAYLKALEYDPTDANALTELGLMYMQWGREEKARAALEKAWVLDPYNERTQFTLELLETIEKLATFETDNFIIRFDAEKDPGLGEFLGAYLEELYAEVTGDFGTPLKEKTVIQVFPTHRQFGVRITGKPWIHTVGACTGRVIAMSASRRSPELTGGTYNMAHVLKHEFTHTVTLAATRNRIPHWFTEGLAVYQEDSPKSFDWKALLTDSLRKDELFTLASIDWGFMRPRKPNDRQLAYAQSEWMCEFIVSEFGYDKILAMLDRYEEGETQPEVLRGVLDLSMEEFDAQFRVWAKEDASSWCFDLAAAGDATELSKRIEEEGESAALLGELARAYLDAGEGEAALEIAGKALELDDTNPRALGALLLVQDSLMKQARSAEKLREYDAGAGPLAQKMLDVDPDHLLALRMSAEVAMRAERFAEAETQLQKLQRLCPDDPASWSGLAGIYLKRDDVEKAIPQLKQLAVLEPNDADVLSELGSLYRRNNQLGEAAYWAKQALFVEPVAPDLHENLADILMASGKTAEALEEYLFLTRVEPDRAEGFQAAAFAAHKLGKTDLARSLAEKAVGRDPDSPARSLLR